ncbi:DUF4129 domain-containing protein [Paenibacillus sp. MBLB2552]|uniref:DUF4129 domain-containing protein n=1 Tax=Paenibacillus mellifer TaxID=2937794 RepID=A0A9X1XXC9_9BACL|nr:DUF4129 domain-containing protein [Paenibacillus mellifer]MCK8487320.1 DUF4129 domain-containing protein [Paenibacillus mellifer]
MRNKGEYDDRDNELAGKGESADDHQRDGENESAYLVQILRLWLVCLLEYVLLLPAWILFAAYLRPPEFPAAGLGLLPMLTLAGVLLGPRLRKLWQRGAVALVLAAAFTAVAIAWVGGAGSLGFGSTPSAGGQTPAQGVAVLLLQTAAQLAAGLLCSMQGMTVRNRQGSFRLYWAGLGLYFLAGIFYPRIEVLQGTVPLITWAGVFCLGTALFVTNHQYLRYSSHSGDSGQRLPAGLRRHNRLYVGVIIVTAILLAAGVGRWIGGLLMAMLRAVMRWLLRQPKESEPLEQPDMEVPPLEPMSPVESHDSDLLSRILNFAFYAIGSLLIAALLGFAMYWLYKNAGGIWRKAIDRLLSLLRRESAAPKQADYLDEETSLFTWESTLQGWRKMGARLLRPGKPPERWEEMKDNRERVRYLYRLFLRKERERGYPIKPHLTPRETVEEVRLEAEAGRRDESAKAAGSERRRFSFGVRASEKEKSRVQEESDAALNPLLRLYYQVRYGEEIPRDDEVAELRRRWPQ